MKTVSKFTSFADLKDSESKITDYKSRLKKHNDFKKVIREVYDAKAYKTAKCKS